MFCEMNNSRKLICGIKYNRMTYVSRLTKMFSYVPEYLRINMYFENDSMYS